MTHLSGAEALERSGREFRRRLGQINDSQLGLPTTCDEWTVRQLANHVIGGNFRYVMILTGEAPDVILRTHDDDWLARGPLVAFDEGFDRVTEAFAIPGVLQARVRHPKSGVMTGAQLRLLRVNELIVHAWDLARSIGADDRLDGPVVSWLSERLEPLRATIAASGLYKAPSVECHDAEDPQARLLGLLGRVQ